MNANQVYGALKKYVEDTLTGAGALKGEKGDKGDTGAKGENATITVGTVTSGSTSSVTNSGTDTNAILDFVLEKGDKGDKGDQGEQGLPGVDGVSVTVAEHGANNATTYRLEITTKDGTIVTQNLIGRGCKWLEGTELTSTQEYTVLEIADSFDGDYYLNKDTCYVYHRVDDDTTANKWYYVGTLQGAEGDDAYEVAVKDGFIGTRAEWLASLVGRVELIEKVWEKPNLFADTTELDTWYYYKVNNPDNDLALTGVEDGNAWLNKCVMVATKDYPPGNYAYYNGLRYLCFINAAITSPSLTDPDHVYYVLYNEKEQKCAACKCNLDGSNHEMLSSTWVDVFESATLPDGYEEVMLTEYTQLGKWVQTVYIGNSKEFAHEVTLTTGANMQGFVTSATLSELLGEGNLKTVDQTIKGAINEHETLLRGNNNSKVLNTKEKDVFGAINEIFSRQYANVAKCEETSVRAFCDKYVAEKGTEAELTSYFFYSMGIATDVPEGNNGWGYCHCIITQDPQYKILIYYAPDLRKVFMTYDGDTGWSNEWTSNLTNEDIATVLDATATNKQVIGAKDFYNHASTRNIRTYTDVSQLGLRTPISVEEIFNALPVNSILIQQCNGTTDHITNLPEGFGILTITKVENDILKFSIEFKVSSRDSVNVNHLYLGQLKGGDGTGLTWNRVCTTKVPDVAKTNISSKLINTNIYSGGAIQYSVKNGICNVLISELGVSVNTNGATVFPNGSFPKIDINNTNGHYPVTSPNAICGLLVFDTNGAVRYYGDSMTIYATISYPVDDNWRP